MAAESRARVQAAISLDWRRWNSENFDIFVENHLSSCSKYPQKCEKCEEEGIERDKVEFHLERHCPNVTIKCPIVGCTFEGFRRHMDHHIKEQLPNHVVDLAKSLNSLISAFADKEVRQNESLPQEQASQEGCWNELSTRTQQQRNEIDEMRRVMESLSNTVRHLERQQEESRARQDRPLQELSIRPNGYKLCMRINLNGVDSGVGKNVALYVHMVQGDYDDTLDWPFTGKFTLSILDQSDDVSSRRHISKTVNADPNLHSFQRPTAPYNTFGYGYEEFASLEEICEPRYIKNNTLLVKFEMNH
ncbi:hypothetical protein ACROYT_G038020 [Oculina patagonica]